MGFSRQDTGVGSHSLLQGIFLTQRLNPDLLYCRQILYRLNHQGSPCLFLGLLIQIKFFHMIFFIAGVAKSQTQLSDFPLTFHFHALEKEYPLQYLAWRIPWTEELGGPWSIGSQRVGHD